MTVGDTLYHDLEGYDAVWYSKLKLPNAPEPRYYTLYQVLGKLPGKSIAYTVRDKNLE